MNIAVVLAGGVGKRLGLSMPKQFMKVSGRMVIEYSIEAFEKNPDIDEIAIVSHADYVGEFQEMVRRNAWKKVRRILLGGKERYDSSLSAIRAYEDRTSYLPRRSTSSRQSAHHQRCCPRPRHLRCRQRSHPLVGHYPRSGG